MWRALPRLRASKVRLVSRNGFRRRARLLSSAASAFVAVTLVSVVVQARRSGIISADCFGCHESGGAAVEISALPAMFAPGDDVTFTVTVRRLTGTAGVGGVSIGQPATGQLHTIAGEGLTLVADAGLTHSQPKQAVGGIVTFRFGWRAPAEPGGIVFNVGAVAGNGDGRPSGDVTGFGRFLATFGCEPAAHYADLDRDGHGTDLFEQSIGCVGTVPPAGFSTLSDDCNDNDQTVFPTAVEKCNKKDDDCDAEVDENAELVELWPDMDGDGYFGTKTGTAVIGCSGMTGYAAEPGDCSPNDAAVHPGVTEVCNLVDDNCDARVDERLRPQCGEGRCRRESYDCDAAHCAPGVPIPERCNYLDDDCNGEVDDGELCAAGSACLAGKCVVTEGVGGGAGGPATGTGGAAVTGGAGPASAGSASDGATGGTGSTGGGGVPSSAGGSSDGGFSNTGNPGGASVPDPAVTSSGCALAVRELPSARFGAVLGLVAMLFGMRRRRSR
jgi:hypothetical protein